MEDIFLGTPSGAAQLRGVSLSPSPETQAEASTSNTRTSHHGKHKKHPQKHKRSREDETNSSKKLKKLRRDSAAHPEAGFDPNLSLSALEPTEEAVNGKESKEERRRRKEEKRRRKFGVGESADDGILHAATSNANGQTITDGLEDDIAAPRGADSKEQKREKKEGRRSRKSDVDTADGTNTAAVEVQGNGKNSTQVIPELSTSTTKKTKSVGSSRQVPAETEATSPDETPSSSPRTASQLNLEPSATPLVALTPNTAKRLLVTRPLRAPVSPATASKQRSSKQSVPPVPAAAATTSGSRSTRKSQPGSSLAQRTRAQSEEKVDDATLKKRLNGPKAVEEWIANNWVTEAEMRRLERCGVLIYKKGKFSEDEKTAIRQALQNYQKVQRLNDHQLVDLIMSTKLNSPLEKEDWRSFWLDLAAVVPGRPVAYVQRSVQRMYDPKGHKGAWTPEEDDALMRAYVKYPNQWGKISEVVDRTLYDCRDRYTKELSRGSDRTTGRWAPEEEAQLIASVNKINRSLGRDEWQEDDIPWELVAKDMGGKRSLKQCRVKWSEVVMPKRQGLGGEWNMSDRFKILDRIELLNLRSEKHLDWRAIRTCESLEHLSTKQISNAYHHLKRGIPNASSMDFDELLKAMRRHTSELQIAAGKKRIKSRARVVSDDEGDDENGEPRNKEKPKREGKQGRGDTDEPESPNPESVTGEKAQGLNGVRTTDGMSSD
ncbi:hypothetical protein I316_01252 [Kwoniella heveanensis BCC8398]|uniref:Nucleolar protein n=1 Tax=Kwoniella heveanensis BCC8398 TaxID=1296120 RepID=A0A1B9H232_9TREE|nr:hypothetical protein I316_01252 [Kwoniella heveanensis BCC8398]